MRDQLQRQLELDEQRYLQRMWLTLIIVFTAFVCIALVFTMVILEIPVGHKETAYNHAVSTELQSYINGPGKGVFINEGGLE
jgi:hypothetical protein